MKNYDIYFYEEHVKRNTNSEKARVNSWREEIYEMLPDGVDLSADSDAIREICQRFGFYSYHLMTHLAELHLVRQINTNLYRKV